MRRDFQSMERVVRREGLLDEALNHPDLESDRAALARIQALRRDASSSG